MHGHGCTAHRPQLKVPSLDPASEPKIEAHPEKTPGLQKPMAYSSFEQPQLEISRFEEHCCCSADQIQVPSP